MSVSTSVGNSVVALLGTITITANTAARSVNTAASALDMLDQYVQDARRNQIARSAFAEEENLTDLEQEITLRVAERETNLKRKLDADPTLAQFYLANAKKFAETRKKVEAKLAQMNTLQQTPA